jgi:small basic protein (TIGR04137 family)
MSVDNSLRLNNQMARHRNVLTRAERVYRLQQQGQFDIKKDDPLALPKVGNRKLPTGKK